MRNETEKDTSGDGCVFRACRTIHLQSVPGLHELRFSSHPLWTVNEKHEVDLVFQRGQDSGFLVEWTAMFSFRHEATPSAVSPVNRFGKYLVELHSLRFELFKVSSSLQGLHL